MSDAEVKTTLDDLQAALKPGQGSHSLDTVAADIWAIKKEGVDAAKLDMDKLNTALKPAFGDLKIVGATDSTPHQIIIENAHHKQIVLAHDLKETNGKLDIDVDREATVRMNLPSEVVYPDKSKATFAYNEAGLNDIHQPDGTEFKLEGKTWQKYDANHNKVGGQWDVGLFSAKGDYLVADKSTKAATLYYVNGWIVKVQDAKPVDVITPTNDAPDFHYQVDQNGQFHAYSTAGTDKPANSHVYDVKINDDHQVSITDKTATPNVTITSADQAPQTGGAGGGGDENTHGGAGGDNQGGKAHDQATSPTDTTGLNTTQHEKWGENDRQYYPQADGSALYYPAEPHKDENGKIIHDTITWIATDALRHYYNRKDITSNELAAEIESIKKHNPQIKDINLIYPSQPGDESQPMVIPVPDDYHAPDKPPSPAPTAGGPAGSETTEARDADGLHKNSDGSQVIIQGHHPIEVLYADGNSLLKLAYGDQSNSHSLTEVTLPDGTTFIRPNGKQDTPWTTTVAGVEVPKEFAVDLRGDLYEIEQDGTAKVFKTNLTVEHYAKADANSPGPKITEVDFPGKDGKAAVSISLGAAFANIQKIKEIAKLDSGDYKVTGEDGNSTILQADGSQPPRTEQANA